MHLGSNQSKLTTLFPWILEQQGLEFRGNVVTKPTENLVDTVGHKAEVGLWCHQKKLSHRNIFKVPLCYVSITVEVSLNTYIHACTHIHILCTSAKGGVVKLILWGISTHKIASSIK